MTTEVVHLITLKLLILKINILLEEKIYILVKKTIEFASVQGL